LTIVFRKLPKAGSNEFLSCFLEFTVLETVYDRVDTTITEDHDDSSVVDVAGENSGFLHYQYLQIIIIY